MKEFVMIFRLSGNAGTSKPSPEQLQERMNWLGGIAALTKSPSERKTLLAELQRLDTERNPPSPRCIGASAGKQEARSKE